jgi:transposase-like protein
MSQQQRRTFSAEFKLETVMEVLRGEKPIAQVCRERNLTESLVHKWRAAFVERAPGIFEDKRSSSTGTDQRDERIAELERMVGRLTMENEVLKKDGSWLLSQRRNSRTNGR